MFLECFDFIVKGCAFRCNAHWLSKVTLFWGNYKIIGVISMKTTPITIVQ